MSGDALRNTLDHLALDPNAGQDRHYLITLLRRLGYSEQEIKRVLGDAGEESRVIEVEYTGGGATTFTFGEEGSQKAAAEAIAKGEGSLTFTMAGDDGEPMQFKLAQDEEAGVETFDTVELGDGDIGDDWGDWSDDDVPDTGVGDFTSDAPDDFAGGDEDLVQFKEKPLVQFREKRMRLVPFSVEGDDDPALAAGWQPVDEEAESPAEDAWDDADAWGPIDDAPADAWEPAEEDDVEWAAADTEEPAQQWAQVDEDTEWAAADTEEPMQEWAPADAEDQWEPETPYTHGDYTLHTRAVELTTGKTQQIYFFAKDTPKSGEPSSMPDGYEVGVSEKTGLPFLRKIHDGDAPEPIAKRQCGAITEGNKQCRLTAQVDSDYCHIHQAYEAPTEGALRDRLDTVPSHDVDDTLPGEQGHGKQQCAAVTAAGMQCRNTARHDSKYCTSHKGYRPHSATRDTDTRPVGRRVEDTLPSTQGDEHPKAGPEGHADAEPVAFREADPFDEDPAHDGPDSRDGSFGVHAPEDPSTPHPDAVPEPSTPQTPDQPAKRVRMQRVQADSPEEARRLIAKQGGDVRGVVPIRLEEHDD